MSKNFSFKLQLGIKRMIDVIIALLILAFSFPFLLVIGILVKLDSPGPVLYRHRRVGKNGHPFEMYKFRTMVVGGDDAGYMNYLRELIESAKENPIGGKPYTKMKDDSRVTRVGRVLRKVYLDELPQMLNVLKGELSLVGPRPHVQFEVDHYTLEQRRRLSVKPGATGLWQVTGKADCTFDELLAYDLEYIDKWSIWLDLEIVFMTFFIMLRGGEDFWTRTSKRIPRPKRLDFNPRLASSPKTDSESLTKGGDGWSKRKSMPVLRRTASLRGDRTIEKISSIDE
jgi:lipopolysaccharide/colanic/teichoic acid biosynthesis glycosyltransferase